MELKNLISSRKNPKTKVTDADSKELAVTNDDGNAKKSSSEEENGVVTVGLKTLYKKLPSTNILKNQKELIKAVKQYAKNPDDGNQNKLKEEAINVLGKQGLYSSFAKYDVDTAAMVAILNFCVKK